MDDPDQAELDRLAAVEAIGALADELGIETGPVRGELLGDPERACRLMEHAIDNRSKLRSPTGFVLSRFRKGEDAPAKAKAGLGSGVAPLFEREPMSVAELEAAVEYAERAVAEGKIPDVALLTTRAALTVARERGSYTEFTLADRVRFSIPADPLPD